MTAVRTSNQLVRIAVIGLAVLTLGFLLAVNVQRLPLVGNGTSYRAEFTDAAGLVPGEEVRIAGIKVGTVTGIELGTGTAAGHVVVRFTVKGTDLGRETTAGIEVKTILGQHYLSVSPSGAGAMPADSTIPLRRTTTPMNIVPVFQRLAQQSTAIDTEQVAKAFDALSETLDRTAPEMTGALRGLSRISRSVTARDEEIRELFARTSYVSGVVADRDQDIARLLQDTNTVLAELDRRRVTITRIIRGTRALAVQLGGLVKDNQAQLAPTLEKLNGVLAVLRRNKVNLDQALRVGAVYGREFVSVGGSGHWFDATIKIPQSFALCATDAPDGGVSGLLTSVLGQLNQAVNQSSKPCLPLGPAVRSPR